MVGANSLVLEDIPHSKVFGNPCKADIFPMNNFIPQGNNLSLSNNQ